MMRKAEWSAHQARAKAGLPSAPTLSNAEQYLGEVLRLKVSTLGIQECPDISEDEEKVGL